MSEEIKLISSSVHQRIEQINTSVKSLNTDFRSEVKGNNELKMVDTMEEINQSIEEALISYQKLLFEHISSTTTAVNNLEETEKNLATEIRESF